jgi:hypothetical protein
VVESSALLKRRSPKGYRGFESLPHRFHRGKRRYPFGITVWDDFRAAPSSIIRTRNGLMSLRFNFAIDNDFFALKIKMPLRGNGTPEAKEGIAPQRTC